MTKPLRAANEQDEADRIVETLLADPGHAEDVKTELRGRLRRDPSIRVVATNGDRSAIRDEVEEMWDNVPV